MCLIAELLAPDWTSPWTRGHEWTPWNREHVSGARIEIQQSAARQPSHVGQFAGKKSSWFAIVSPDGYWMIDGSWMAPPGGVAEIYIFAWHGEARESAADHRAPEQWRFFVLPARNLPARQRIIGLLEIEELTDAIGIDALARAVQETLDGL